MIDLIPVEPKAWPDLCSQFHDHNLRQCSAYVNALGAKDRSRTEFVAISDSGTILGVACLRIRQLPIVGGGIAYVGGGPLVRRTDRVPIDILATCLKSLIREYSERRGLILRILPPICDPREVGVVSDCFHSCGLEISQSIPVYETAIIDLKRDIEVIRADLHRKWRYNLRRSERACLDLCHGSGDDLFAQFSNLHQTVASQKRFNSPISAEFYRAIQQNLALSEKLMINVAFKEGVCVAGALWSFTADTAVSLLSALHPLGRQYRAGYLIRWRALEIAHERGMRWMDAGGVNKIVNPDIASFKLGMGGRCLTSPGPFEFIPKKTRNAVAIKAERLYRRLSGRRVLRPHLAEHLASGSGRIH